MFGNYTKHLLCEDGSGKFYFNDKTKFDAFREELLAISKSVFKQVKFVDTSSEPEYYLKFGGKQGFRNFMELLKS